MISLSFKNSFSTLLVMASLFLSSAAQAELRYMRRIIAISSDHLVYQATGARLEAEAYRAGDRVVYTGASELITSNGISSMNTKEGGALHLIAGQVLVVCKNQFIDYRDFAVGDEPGKKVVRAHFVIELDGHAGDCRCGVCGYTARILADPFVEHAVECTCEQKAPLDPGQQTCTVM
jgi:hypothetical protein